MKGFKNVCAYIENKGIIKCDIAVDNQKIVAIGSDLNISFEYTFVENGLVVPGFIDEHIHGAGGADAMDGEVDKLKTIANCLAAEGTTCFLATTMTQSPKNIIKSLSAIKEYIGKNFSDGAKLLGVHLEGPFISEKHIGAQPLEFLQKADVNTFIEYNNASGNNIKIVTVAPEIDGAKELIAYLNKNGIVASAGHTDAGYEDMITSVSHGLRCVTHTFNAQKGIHHRDIGTAGAALMVDALSAEMICDLIHLSAPTIKMIVKNKPHDKIILITDAMRAKGIPDGISELGGQKVIVKNGQARLENGALAGSVLKMNDAIKNLVADCNVPLTDAIDYATINPSKNLGISNTKGSIAINKDADFAVLDGNFGVVSTIREGKIIYQK